MGLGAPGGIFWGWQVVEVSTFSVLVLRITSAKTLEI